MWPFSHPDLEFDPRVVPVDGLDFEVDAHRADKGRREGVVCVAEQEGGLSHTAVADDEQLEHVVEVLVGRLSRVLARRRISGRRHLPIQAKPSVIRSTNHDATISFLWR